ncbi:TPA: hypothetical protein ACH3X2_006523 [Trebouxia sp. C0005]
MPLSVTVGDLKQEAHELLGIPPAMQKLLIKGQMNPDGTTLQQAGLRSCVRKAAGHPLSCCPSFFSWLSLGLPDPFRRRPSAHTDAAQEGETCFRANRVADLDWLCCQHPKRVLQPDQED